VNPQPTAERRWLVVSCAPGEDRKRTRAEFSSEAAMRLHATRLLEGGDLIGTYWEPADVRVGPKALRREAQQKLREETAAQAKAEWRSMFPDDPIGDL
jgi:hypothetical protein